VSAELDGSYIAFKFKVPVRNHGNYETMLTTVCGNLMIKGKKRSYIDIGPRLLLPVFTGASATSLPKKICGHIPVDYRK